MPPDWTFEKQCFSEGYRCVAGIDEVGMGCLAGPVVAAAVILDPNDIPEGLDDSKKLSEKIREKLADLIQRRARAHAVGWASVEEIDRINIYHAARLAMRRAVETLSVVPDFCLVDGKGESYLPSPQRAVVKGDQKSYSIAAASILAKVYRDRWMCELDVRYPGYGFASHKGYGSISHRLAIQTLGPTPLHRKSFSWTPVPTPIDLNKHQPSV